MNKSSFIKSLFSRILVMCVVAGTLILLPFSASADHNAGGDLTWECLANGKFRFTLRLYRFCEGIPLGSSAYVSSTSPVSSMILTRTYYGDITPQGYDSTLCTQCNSVSNTAFTIEEHVYVSSDIQITGVPPSTGWDFYWSSCCRPAPAVYGWGNLLDNLEPQNQSYRIKASMFPYNGQNTYPCYDNSPQFAEPPVTKICTGYSFTYNHSAEDKDLDSLTFIWGTPLLSTGAPVSYATHLNTSQVTPRASGGNFIVPSPGFSANVPLPWAHANMSVNNVPATINFQNGEVKFKSYTKGQYATTVIVKSYRCGIKIAEIMRDIPVILIACPPTPTIPPLTNSPPQVTFKWSASSTTSIPLPAGDSVWAGDSVSFYITSTDIEFLPGFIGQTNYLIPGGSHFGTGFADTANGCLFPPCATMDTSSSYFNPAKQWWEGQYGVATKFSWKTDCNHLNYVDSCFTSSNKYNFIFKVKDNWCPAPGANFQTFTVTVLAPPSLEPPKLKCSKTLANGNVLLTWDQPVSKAEDTLHSFRKYIIYRADSANGVYDTIHIVQNIDSLEYLDANANALSLPKYYFIQGISSCNDQSVRTWSDTIASLVLNTQPYNNASSVALNWNDFNPGNNFGNKTTGYYYVWQILNSDTNLIDSTITSWDSIDVSLCYPSVAKYFITVKDTSMTFGCSSYSNTETETVGDIVPPLPIILDSVSYDVNNIVQLGWQRTSADIFKYYIYRGGVLIDSISSVQESYTYTPSSTDSCNLVFAIGARDTCGNTSAMGNAQSTMCTRIIDVARCDTNKGITFMWDLYNPSWTFGNSTQEIWRSVNGGPFVLFDTVSANVNVYIDTSIVDSTTYAYRVRSFESGKNRSAWTSTISYYIDVIITGTIVDPPELRCVSWKDNTTVRIDWIKPNNQDKNFNWYIIYHSTLGTPGTFLPVDTFKGMFTSDNLAWDSVGFTHNGVDPNASHYYYVESMSGCDGFQPSIKSNVLRTIDLKATAISDSVNVIEWNKISGTKTGNNYTLTRDGAFMSTYSYGTESSQDKLIVCSDSVAYQVSFDDLLNYCVSYSKEIYGYYEDDTPPAKQFIDSVSMLVDSSFTGMVGWSSNNSKDILSYLVLNCTGGKYKVLDTLPASARYFLDSANAPLNGATQYTVSGIDSCGNSNMKSGNFDCQRTMYLKAKLDKCERSVHLTWNAYTDFSSGQLPAYKIFASIENGPFAFVGQSNVNSFEVKDLIQGSYYCFYVQAWDNQGLGPFSSSSALECLRYNGIKTPDYAYMRYVTVDSGNVRMCMKIDLNSDLGEYWIRRSADPKANFQIISTVVVPDPLTDADSNFCFQDNNVETDKRPFYYYIEVVDPCGTSTAVSNLAKTIHLKVYTDKERNLNVLTWNKYIEWQGGVDEYEIHRSVDNGPPTVITLKAASMAGLDEVDVKGDEITFRDDVSKEANTGNGEFCYTVVAKEGSATFMKIPPEVSKSNIVCAFQTPLFYAPNAFTPNGDGLNDKFMPAIAFQDLKSFSMQIYNRWGARIFTTDDPKSEGWDGTAGGNPVPDGAYVYIVKFAAADGQEYEEQGTVTLSR